MNTAPRFSVVVPSWNRADLLPETLDRILGQTLPADEVIVVDDGSEDDTPALLDRYKSQGVRAIRIANSGDLHARNVGLDAACGELVAFCDSDDLWEPEFLSAMRSVWQLEPELCAAYADFRIVRGTTWEEPSKFTLAPPGFWDGLRSLGADAFAFDQPMAARLIQYQPFFPSALVVDRRFLLAAGGWDEGTAGMIGRDFATALRIAEHAPVGVLRRPLVGIRKHASNDSGDTLAMNIGDSLVLQYVLHTRPGLAAHRAAIEASMVHRRRQALDAAFARGQYGLVREIAGLLPPGALPPLARLKHGVSGLPGPVRAIASNLALTGGTLLSWAGRAKRG